MFLSVLVLTCLAAWATAQQQPPSTNEPTEIAKQYADSFHNLGGRVLYDKVNVNEYTDGHGRKVTGPLNLVAAVNDAGSHGLNLSDANTHKQIIVDAVHSGYLSTTNEIDSEGFYVLVAGNDVRDSNFCNTNCGYNYNGDQFQYMYIGYPGQCPDRCVPTLLRETSPNNNPAIDAAITIFSHELQDILTNPQGDGWVIQDGQTKIELGDFCSGAGVSFEQWFGNISSTASNAKYNLAIGDDKYLVQTVFSQKKKACVLAS
ncbi:hypothetical protein DFQ28_000957 [Apophysomyces sp. BC1034]|nr:hypothetical protein DFQ30_008760 [Apophysomyces sp. BC1015]KAG0183318.1 hypothetical protein DFQ29_006887 [Apophysomyces sp. BC1021]KAG0194238.1 hypothetical protein DFQ28_000957 [Apophysomyces sp. BC1034]